MVAREVNMKIGLEIHCQLTSLSTKLFCSCPSNYRGKPPNSNVCPVCLGLPGALPVLNENAVEAAARVAIALHSNLSKFFIFFRKNYFYPDMSKNYQISQYDKAGGIPLAVGGYIKIPGKNGEKKIRIRRIQLEEDPAKLVHRRENGHEYTLVDYNRSGVALIEIVTEPDIKSPKEARILLQKLQSILEHLGVFDSHLEGSMRCDANISVKGSGRVEIKNISSFKDVEKALRYEAVRLSTQRSQENVTRRWDEVLRVTLPMRTKESEADYRYFPEPNLPPVELSEEFIEYLYTSMPELPDIRAKRFIEEYGLEEYYAHVLTMNKELADYFEEAVKYYDNPINLSHWVVNELNRRLSHFSLTPRECKLRPEGFISLLKMLDERKITPKIAKDLLWSLVERGGDPVKEIQKLGLRRMAEEDTLMKIVDKIFESNKKAVEDALKNPKAIDFLIGEAIKRTRGQADPLVLRKIIERKLRDIK